MVLYIENPKDSVKKQLGLTKEYSSMAGYKINIQKSVAFFKRFYLFLERGREREREGEKHQCVVVSCTPPTGDLAHNPGTCPRLGIEPATFWFAGRHSIYWATPATATFTTLIQHSTGSHSWAQQTRKKKSHPNWEGISKLSLFADDMIL